MRRKHRPIASTLLFAALAILFARPAWSEATKITIGYLPNGAFTPLFIAKEKGGFEKAGLDATLTSVVNQHNVPAALSSGSIDLGPMAAPTFLLAAENGVDIVAVAGFTRNLASKPETNLMIRQGMAFAAPTSLEGKRVGIPGLQSAFDLHFRIWLLNAGVPLDRVSMVEVNFPQMAGMLKSGQIDAAIAVEPFRSEIVRSGAGTLGDDFIGAVSKNDAGLIWVATRAWAVAHAKERAAFIAAMKESVARAFADAPGAEAVEKQYLKFASPLTNDYDFSLSAADLVFYAQMMRKVDFLHKDIDIPHRIVQ